jgi:hypothetical protein
MERKPVDWEKIIVNHICDKGLIPKTNKKFTQLNSKINNLIENGAEDLNRHFSNEYAKK